MRRLPLVLILLAACGGTTTPSSPPTVISPTPTEIHNFVTARVKGLGLIQLVTFAGNEDHPCVASGKSWETSFDIYRDPEGASIEGVEYELEDCISITGTSDFAEVSFSAEGFGEMTCTLEVDGEVLDEDTNVGGCYVDATF